MLLLIVLLGLIALLRLLVALLRLLIGLLLGLLRLFRLGRRTRRRAAGRAELYSLIILSAAFCAKRHCETSSCIRRASPTVIYIIIHY